MVMLERSSSAQPASLPQQLVRMDSGRLRAYRENLEFYQGRQWNEPPRRANGG